MKKKKKKPEYLDRIQIELFDPAEVRLKDSFYTKVHSKGLDAKFVTLGLIRDYMKAQKY